MLRAKGFPEEDIILFSQLYTCSFLVMVNTFGTSAACFLTRGMPQGAQTSPRNFNLLVDPIHALLRWCQRGCTVLSRVPNGTSGFADDTVLHADGPDAIPALAIMAQMAGDYVIWAGMKINMDKSGIRAADMGTGRPVPTDSVTLNGVPFPVILPDQPYKHLGVRGTMLGDFTAEKQHVLGDMAKKLKALQEDRLLTRKEKEQVIITAVCSVFNYSAGVVDWTKAELDHISKMWATAYKQAWTLPRSADGSPFLLDQSHAGRGCPSATGMWTRAVLEVLEQSVGLPGEISEMVLQHLQRQCTAYGCQTLNQLQLMLRVSGKAETVLELFLQRLDEYGLEISSPWRSSEE